VAPDQARDRTGPDTGTQPLPVGVSTSVGPPFAPPHGDPPHGAPPHGLQTPGTNRWTPRHWIVLALCALVGTAVGVGAQELVNPRGGAASATPAPTTSAAPTPVGASVSSFDPEGTGFPRNNGGVWTSEGYATAKFGKLKPGIGLLLDLGTARPLRAVTFDVRTGPLTVELRAADSEASDIGGYQRVGTPVSAQGSTSLPATAGGSHRYWMIWVTQLGPSEEKFRAQIGSVTAQG
jgi:eukaryotic-like serine/threonine-protein kinase